MTILSAAQKAIMTVVGTKPAAVVSSTDQICVEMTALADTAAVEIAKSHDWQALTEFYTLTANGADSAYPFPPDYDRMVQATDLYDPNNWCWGYQHVTDYGQWIEYETSGIGFISPGVWTIRRNEFHFLPVPEDGQQAIFPYISRNIFTDANGIPKDEITSDNDRFILSERLLTLSLIWRWLARKGMDYQQEFADFELALSQEQTRDKGSRVIRSRRPGRTLNTRPALPWPLSGE